MFIELNTNELPDKMHPAVFHGIKINCTFAHAKINRKIE